MTSAFLAGLDRAYCRYVDSFRDGEGGLQAMLQLKLEHTRRVVSDAKLIMEGEGFFSPERQLVGEACALLHDAGRYSQFTEFQTFQDARSVDHAQRGVEVIRREGWLDALPGSERELILDAVLYHNKKELPETLPRETLPFAQLTRDADKMDIFRLFEMKVGDGELKKHPEIAWGLPLYAPPSERVSKAVCSGQPVDYRWIESLADFVLIQVGWLGSGLYFGTSLRLAGERGVLDHRRDFLKEFCDPSEIERICACVQERVDRRLGE